MEMTRLEKILGVMCIALLVFIVGVFGYAISQAAYETMYNNAVKDAYNTMRVTTVQDEGDKYIVVIKDLNDDVYLHNISK